ncbi:MAG: 5'/3'-nucleotidase SurE [Gammaproteobacteria bacterium]
MRILITNDDGIEAAGINALAGALGGCGDIFVVAPAANQSGVSAALTLRRNVAVSPLGGGRFVVDGTPADCVHLALSSDFVPRPDIIVSGINDGPNLGEDTVYSGTVAAAVCAHLHDIPALAISLVAGRNAPSDADLTRDFDGACRAAKQLVQSGMIKSGKSAVVNINAPNIPAADIKGNRITRLGRRAASSAAMRCDNDKNGVMHFAIGPSGPVKDGGEGTDFFAVANNYVAITPLVVAGLESCTMEDVRGWLE